MEEDFVGIAIDEAIDSYLSQETRERETGVYFPSEIGKCLRQMYYIYTTPPKKFSPETLRVMQSGNIVHNFIKYALMKEKDRKGAKLQLITNERSITLPMIKDGVIIRIRGRMDNKIMVKTEGGAFYIVEVKSQKSVENLYEHRSDHKEQLMFYLLAENCKGCLMYIGKDNLATKYFNFDLDMKLINKLIDRFFTVHNAVINKKIPEPEAWKSYDKKWQCQFCNYQDECKKDGRG